MNRGGNFFANGVAALVVATAVLLAFSATPSPAQGIIVKVAYAPINVLSLSDIDFTKSSTPQWFFSVDITAPGGSTIVAVATVELSKVVLSSGEQWTDPPPLKIVSKSFVVQGSRTFTNLDFGPGKGIQDSSSEWNPDVKRVFQDVSLPSGQLPAGTYTFTITVREIFPVSSEAGDGFSLLLTNPSSVELFFPSDGDQHVSQLPLFQWMFDGAQSKISIFEMLPGQSSLEEAAQGVPLVTQETTTPSFQFPSGGVRSLQPGHTYVWYVEGEVRALGGRNSLLKSSLRSFTVESGPSAVSSLLDELELTLDAKYKPLFDQIRSEGLSFTGSIRLNGAAIQASELLEILKYFRTHPDAVQSAGLE
ncbi:MAG: hypothetical protein WB699_01280 [Bacteroidota bacterium]